MDSVSLIMLLGLLAGGLFGWLFTWLVMRRRIGEISDDLEAAAHSHRERRRAVEDENVRQRLQIARLEVENDALSRRLRAAGGRAASSERANGRELSRFAAHLRRLSRLGEERGRLLRGAFRREEAEAARVAGLQLRIRRQNLALDALSDALEHAKRAQRSADLRATDLRGTDTRAPALPAAHVTGASGNAPSIAQEAGDGPHPGADLTPDATPDIQAGGRVERIIEVPVDRIIEVPVERVVYRDREVRVEVPFALPRELSPRPPSGARSPDTGTAPD